MSAPAAKKAKVAGGGAKASAAAAQPAGGASAERTAGAKSKRSSAAGASGAKGGMDKKVLELCDDPQTADFLMKKLEITRATMMECINRLAAKKLLNLVDIDGKLKFHRATDSQRQLEAKLTGHQERLVYQAIKQAHTRGIWAKNLKDQTGLEPADFKRVTRKLESQELIKREYAVTAPKKPIYMLFGLTPDVSLTGGAFYGDDKKFDVEFIHMLRSVFKKFAEDRLEKAAMQFPSQPLKRMNASYFTATDALKFIVEADVTSEPLGEKDVAEMLNTLVWETTLATAVVERSDFGSEAEAEQAPPRRYKIRSVSLALAGGTLVTPCDLCPIYHLRCEDGEVRQGDAPGSCKYAEAWTTARARCSNRRR